MSDPSATATAPVDARVLVRGRLELRVVDGPDAGQKRSFEERIRLGSRNMADLVLRDPLVSGLHCEVIVTPPVGIVVRDLGSKNGTWIGAVRVVEAVLPPGEALRLGDTRCKVVAAGEVEVPLRSDPELGGIVGRSAVMRALTAKVERLAGSDATVLIQGETGVGKELVAEALHAFGPRASGPFVIVDTGSMPANLVEAELLGYEKGAFTGAASRVAGAFERAHGGTIFLDEIGELLVDLQPKLLRVLESRQVRRLGSAAPMDVDVRVVAATNRDLALAAARGRFREDLYYRLAVVSLTVPPLRDRLDDIPLLASHLLEEMRGDPATILSPDVLADLASYEWPGNVRELRNVLERAVTLREPVSARHLAPVPTGLPGLSVDLSVPLREGKQRLVEQYERAYVTALLAQSKGNISRVARRAGMDRVSIHRIIQRLRLRGESG